MINQNVGYWTDDNGINVFGEIIHSKNDIEYIAKGIAVFIKSICESIEDGSQFYELQYDKNGEDTTLLLPLKKFNRAGLLELKQFGVDVNENNIYTLIAVLQNEEYTLKYINKEPVKYFHSQVGWYNYKNQIMFRGISAIAIGEDGQTVSISKYNGDYNLNTKGTLSEWKDFLKREIIGHTPLELAVILGLSSVLNGYIGDIVDCPNILVNLVGDSSSGKTTASMLALSTASMPRSRVVDNKLSFMRSWNGTSNAILNSLNGNLGFPVVIDELSLLKTRDASSLGYAFSWGEDKNRLNGDSQQIKTSSFKTTVISTGECSLLNKCNSANTGIRVRVIELTNISWTTSAEHSNRVKKGCLEHYGTAIYKMAQQVLNVELEELLYLFELEKENFLNNISIDSKFIERVSIQYAMIMLTTKLAKECLKLDFNYKAILELLIENINVSYVEENQFEDIGTRAYDKLIEYVNINGNLFISRDVTNFPKYSEIQGKIDDDFIIIPKSKFEIIMKSLNFESVMPILKIWKEKGLILYNEHEKRFTKRKKLFMGGDNVSCYFIYRPKETLPKIKPKQADDTQSKTETKVLRLQNCGKSNETVEVLSSEELPFYDSSQEDYCAIDESTEYYDNAEQSTEPTPLND